MNMENLEVQLGKLATMQEVTTKALDDLIKVVKTESCGKNACRQLGLRIDKLEDKVDEIESIPNKLFMRFIIVLISSLAVFLIASLN